MDGCPLPYSVRFQWAYDVRIKKYESAYFPFDVALGSSTFDVYFRKSLFCELYVRFLVCFLLAVRIMSVFSELSGCPSLFAFSSRAAFAPSTLYPRRKHSSRTITPSITFPPQNNGNVLTTLAWLLGWDTPLGLLSLDTTLWYNATWLGYSDW